MTRIAVVTDSNSGITQAQGEKLGVRVLPMRFFLESEQDERIVYLNATKSEFFPKAGQQVTLKCFGRHVKEVV